LALPVAKELALDQLARDRAAVDGDEAPLAPARQMYGARVDLLAGAGLAQDQELAVRRGQAPQAIAGQRQRRAHRCHRSQRIGELVLDRLDLDRRRQSEDRDVVADEDQRAVVQRDALLDADVVDPGAVLAAEIDELVAIVVVVARSRLDDPRVVAGDQRVVEDRAQPTGTGLLGRAPSDLQIISHEQQASRRRQRGLVGAADHQQERNLRELARRQRRVDRRQCLVVGGAHPRKPITVSGRRGDRAGVC
jgi:hypothetical protein